jgi:hypothetical protein
MSHVASCCKRATGNRLAKRPQKVHRGGLGKPDRAAIPRSFLRIQIITGTWMSHQRCSRRASRTGNRHKKQFRGTASNDRIETTCPLNFQINGRSRETARKGWGNHSFQISLFRRNEAHRTSGANLALASTSKDMETIAGHRKISDAFTCIFDRRNDPPTLNPQRDLTPNFPYLGLMQRPELSWSAMPFDCLRSKLTMGAQFKGW